eukprot:COSAG04_NODE_1483_length_6561_cov_1.989941_3_plen_33_part_00
MCSTRFLLLIPRRESMPAGMRMAKQVNKQQSN